MAQNVSKQENIQYLCGQNSVYLGAKFLRGQCLEGKIKVCPRYIGPRIHSRFAVSETDHRLAAGKSDWYNFGRFWSSKVPFGWKILN
eukprot:5353638-Pyramimonas_sp.AAC.2